MKNILIPVLLIAFVIVISACSNDDDEICNTVATGSLESLYNCVNTQNNMDFTFASEYEIIRTQGRFDSVILGNCKPIIDFTTYDIIVGEETTSSGVDTIEYEYTPPCNGLNGDLEVKIIRNAAAVVETVTYHALIPKLQTSETVTVNVLVE